MATTSGTYNFTFDAGELVTEAAERAGLDPSRLNSRHLLSMRRSLNLLLTRLETSDTGNVARLDRDQLTLSSGVAAYELPPGTIDILDMSITDASNNYWDPSRTTREDYLRLERQSTTIGRPVQYWVSRELPSDPTHRSGSSPYYAQAYDTAGGTGEQTSNEDSVYLLVWPAPNATMTATYYRFRMTQKVGALSEGIDLHASWYDAIAAGLAARTAQKFNPDRYDDLVGEYTVLEKEARMQGKPRGDVIIAARAFGRGRRRRI